MPLFNSAALHGIAGAMLNGLRQFTTLLVQLVFQSFLACAAADTGHTSNPGHQQRQCFPAGNVFGTRHWKGSFDEVLGGRRGGGRRGLVKTTHTIDQFKTIDPCILIQFIQCHDNCFGNGRVNVTIAVVAGTRGYHSVCGCSAVPKFVFEKSSGGFTHAMDLAGVLMGVDEVMEFVQDNESGMFQFGPLRFFVVVTGGWVEDFLFQGCSHFPTQFALGYAEQSDCGRRGGGTRTGTGTGTGGGGGTGTGTGGGGTSWWVIKPSGTDWTKQFSRP